MPSLRAVSTSWALSDRLADTMRMNRQPGALIRSMVRTWAGDWPRMTVPKSMEPGFMTMSLRMWEETPSRASASRPLAVIRRHEQDRRFQADEVARVHLGLDHRRLARCDRRGTRLAAGAAAGGPQVEDRDRLSQPVDQQKVVLDLHAAGNHTEVVPVLGKEAVGPRSGPHRNRPHPDQQPAPQNRPRTPAEPSLPPAYSPPSNRAELTPSVRPRSLPIVKTTPGAQFCGCIAATGPD